MKIMRSMFFGCIAMLAALFCFSSPSMAMSSYVAADFDFVAPVQIKFDVLESHTVAIHVRSTNYRAVA